MESGPEIPEVKNKKREDFMLDLKNTQQRSAHATQMTSFCSLTFTLSNRSNLTLLVAGTWSIVFWLYQSCFQFHLRDVDLRTSITLPIENHDCVPFILELLSKSLWYISLYSWWSAESPLNLIFIADVSTKGCCQEN